MARHNAAEIVTGAAVLTAAGLFLAFAVAHSGRGNTSGYPLLAKFERIDGLAVGADVRLAGVKVGTVTHARIDPKSYMAEVEFTVANGLDVPKDSSAEITSDGLLGGKYLSLVPGGDSTILKAGEAVTITQSAVSLEQLLGKFIFSVSDMKSAATPGAAGTTPAGNPPPAPPATQQGGTQPR